METAKRLQVQDFLLSITSSNSILTLEAESQFSGRIFTVSIDNDVITQITNGLFTNAESLAQGLNDAASGSSSDVKLSFDSQGKMTYTMVLSAGKIKKEESFSISLEEKGKPVRHFDTVDSRVNHLEKTFRVFQGKTEDRFNKLENMMQQMLVNITQRFDTLEKGLKGSGLTKDEASGYLNKLSVNASEYLMNDTDQSITLLTKDHPCIEFLPEVSQKGRSTYSLRIIKETLTTGICFGITTKICKGSWSPNNCHYRYWTAKGGIHGRVNSLADGFAPYGGVSRILKMVVDMEIGMLKFFVDDREINSCMISKSDSYFACVSLGSKGDKVILL